MDLMLTETPMHYAGGGFPWGLLIIGGIVYFLWTKGVFDGRGRFGNGGRSGGFGSGYGPAQGPEGPGYGPAAGAGQGGAPGFSGPRAMFEEWHRQAHEASGTPTHTAAQSAPPASATPPTAAPDAPTSSGAEQAR